MSFLSAADQELLSRLNGHPQLQVGMETLLSILEATGDHLVKADEVEQQIREEMRRMGHEVLSGWAESRIKHSHANLPSGEHIVGSGKKNSTGTVPLAKSK